MPCRIRQFGLLVVLSLTGVGMADDPPASTRLPNAIENPPNGAVGPVAPAALVSDLPFDLWYLWGDDGQPVIVPDKVQLRGYLNWLAREQAKQHPPILYSVASIACTGSGAAEDNVLNLKVTVRVRTTTSEWVFVPLQMAEATLRDPPIYEGPGDALRAPFHPETGYAWWLKGKSGERAEHVLTLSLLVPIRKQPPARRVQLSLPPTAVSSLKLRLPHGRVTAKASEQSKVSVKSAGGASEIDVIGLGPRLDLAWQAAPELPAIDTALEVVTSITATLAEAERTATLVATQTVRAVGQQGTFDQVRVQLPAGGELLSVGSSEYQEHHPDPNDATRFVVKLQRQIAGPVDLRWTVRVPLPAAGEPFVIEGFDVERARIHSGFLAVAIVGDFRLSPVTDGGEDDPQDRSVQRINPEALPVALRQARTTVAYRFENRLRLRLSLRRMEPYVIAAPEAWVHIDPEMLRFAATYEFQVLRGSISDVSFRWPGWKEGGWIVDRIEASENLGPQLLEEASAPDEVRIEFAEPAQKRFHLTIWARRTLPEGTVTAPFALPMAKTPARSAARLAVLRPQNIELTLQPAEGTVLRAQSDSSTRVNVPRELQKLHRDEYRVESPEAAFLATFVVHPRAVTVATTVSASPARSGMIVVRQQIAYDVAFGNMSEVRFAIPPGLKPGQLLVSEVDGNELRQRLPDESTKNEVRVPLDPPRSGPFELDLQFAFEAASATTLNGEQALRIPLVQSNDATISTTQFQWRDAQGREATVRGDGWTRFPDAGGLWAWKLPRAATEVEIVLSQSTGAWGGATITRALLRSSISIDGTIRTRAEYRLTGPVLELSVSLPPEVQLVSVWWDDQELVVATPQFDDQGDNRYRIAPERAGGAAAVLTIDTTTTGEPLSRFSGVSELSAPRFPGNLPVLDCVWQVTLPFSRHLFTEPEGFTPEFRWRPSGVFWKRQPDRTTAELETWVGAQAPSNASTAADEGNAYLFGRAGAAEALRFRAMSQSGIVLVGASIALFLGWILVQWPITRHVLTFLIFGFVAALLAVWFSEPVMVLLQPALLGLLLAAFAAAVDHYGKHRHRPVTIALGSPSGYLAPASSVAQGTGLSVGSNEYTSVRLPDTDHPSESSEPSGQLSETGSRT